MSKDAKMIQSSGLEESIQQSAAACRVYHPLMNQKLPTLVDLKARCVNAEAITLLEDACRIASYRYQQQERLFKAYSDYQAMPQNEPVDLQPDMNKITLTETDMLCALSGKHPELFETVLFNNDENSETPYFPFSEKFKLDSIYWKTILESYQANNPPESLCLRWQRQWALLFIRKPKLQIDIQTWLFSVFRYIPLSWSKYYPEGLMTGDDVFRKLISRFKKNFPAFHQLSIHDFFHTPPAFYDRYGLVSKAEQLMQKHPGVIILGEPSSIKTELVKTLVFRQGQYPFTGYLLDTIPLDKVESLPGHRKVKKIYSFLGNVPESIGGPAWFLDTEDETGGPVAESAFNFFKLLLGFKKEDNAVYVISMTQMEHQTLIKSLPEIKNIPILQNPPTDDRDMIPAYICQLPCVMSKWNISIPLELMLDFLYRAWREHPETLSLSNALQLPFYIDPLKQHFGLISSYHYKTDHERPFNIRMLRSRLLVKDVSKR